MRSFRPFLARLSFAATLLASLVGAPAATHAQAVERPVAFDSSGKLLVVTPALASRLGLRPPEWPVDGEWRVARLFQQEVGGYVLAVERVNGAVQRYPISADAQAVLLAIFSAPASLGAPRDTARARPRVHRLEEVQHDSLRAAPEGTRPAPAARPARVRPASVRSSSPDATKRFVVRQLALAATLHGPLASWAVNDAAGSPSAYLAIAGGSFFLTLSESRRRTFNEAQLALATDHGLRGALGGGALAYAFGAERGPQIATGALIGSILGNVAGTIRGRGLTNEEATASGFGSSVAAAASFGLLAGLGRFDEGEKKGTLRTNAALITAAGVAGLPAGLAYVRGVPYTVTNGDLATLGVGAALGTVVVGAALAANDHRNEGGAIGWLTLGALGGATLADRGFVLQYDHTLGEAAVLSAGTTAGAAIGMIPFFLAGEESLTPYLVSASVGGLLGAWGTQVLQQPTPGTRKVARAGGRRTANGEREVASRTVRFNPTALAFAAARAPGAHSLLTISF